MFLKKHTLFLRRSLKTRLRAPVCGNGLFLSILNAPDVKELISATLTRRLAAPGAWLSLVIILAAVVGLLWKPGQKKVNDAFTLLLILTGAVLVLGPEFVYLRDQFGWRLNTVFKFYYQAWLIWGIAAAYASARLLASLKKGPGIIFTTGLVILLAMSLVYPVFGLWSKTNGFGTPDNWTLDSTAYFAQESHDEMAAIHWLQAAPDGIVAEAVSSTGGSYTNYGRVSMLSGQAAVLGWMGHESQWRGGSQEMGSRQPDLERLYCSRSWEDTLAILTQYQIRYVFVGNLERTTYAANGNTCPVGIYEVKFNQHLTPVFQQGQATIYEVSQMRFP